MEIAEYYLNSLGAAKNARNKFANAFNLDARLPSMVFREQWPLFRFGQFDWLIGERWWRWFSRQEGANNCEIEIYVVDPDPFQRDKNSSDRYQILQLPGNLASSSYAEIISSYPFDWSPDSVMIRANTIAVIPSSGDWAIWGEREYNICIIGTKAIDSEFNCRTEWTSASEALTGWMPVEFPNGVIPTYFEQRFRENYLGHKST